MRRVANRARSSTIADIAIDWARKVGADVGFSHQADASNDTYEALDDAPTDVMTFNSGAILRRGELKAKNHC